MPFPDFAVTSADRLITGRTPIVLLTLRPLRLPREPSDHTPNTKAKLNDALKRYGDMVQYALFVYR